jgi:hypothetical protein
MAGGPNIKTFLTKAYAQQIKEQNVSTGTESSGPFPLLICIDFTHKLSL